MRVIQLAFILRLNAEIIEGRVDRVGVGGLRPAVKSCSSENFIVVAEVIVDPTADEPLLVATRYGLSPRFRTCAAGGTMRRSKSLTPFCIWNGIPDPRRRRV